MSNGGLTIDELWRAIPLQKRIENFVKNCPPAVSGLHGHVQTFLVAMTLVRGFDLSPERALPFLRRYNQRCKPPWSEEELKHKLQNADNLKAQPGKPPPAPRGYLL